MSTNQQNRPITKIEAGIFCLICLIIGCLFMWLFLWLLLGGISSGALAEQPIYLLYLLVPLLIAAFFAQKSLKLWRYFTGSNGTTFFSWKEKLVGHILLVAGSTLTIWYMTLPTTFYEDGSKANIFSFLSLAVIFGASIFSLYKFLKNET